MGSERKKDPATPHTSDCLLQIHLANSTVPIEVNVLDNVVSLQIGEDDWVIQPSLGHFYAQRRRGAFPSDDSTGPYPSLTPLLLLKVTVANQETAIGVSWHHTLGASSLCLRSIPVHLFFPDQGTLWCCYDSCSSSPKGTKASKTHTSHFRRSAKEYSLALPIFFWNNSPL